MKPGGAGLNQIGRFLSPDPYVQVPEYSQNFNRYSYVLNNPLNAIDPSGFSFISKVFHKKLGWLKENWRTVVVIVVVALVTIFSFGTLSGAAAAWGGLVLGATAAASVGVVGTAMVGGAVMGAFAGALGAALAGGDMGDVLRGAAIGAISGAATGALHFVGSGTGFSAANAANVVGHGIVGGLRNMAMGGKFGDGFLSAAASAASSFTGLTNPDSSPMNIYGRTAVAGVVGGTASVLGGGKFSNGAGTAAFDHLVNAEATTESSWKEKVSADWNRFRNWKEGTEPVVSVHGPGTTLSDGLKSSHGVTKLRHYYYLKGQDLENYDYSWNGILKGANGFFHAGFDAEEQFVGSWQDASVSKSGDKLLFVLINKTDIQSYERWKNFVPGMSASPSVYYGPKQTTYQVIWWTEPNRGRLVYDPRAHFVK